MAESQGKGHGVREGEAWIKRATHAERACKDADDWCTVCRLHDRRRLHDRQDSKQRTTPTSKAPESTPRPRPTRGIKWHARTSCRTKGCGVAACTVHQHASSTEEVRGRGTDSTSSSNHLVC